MNNEHKCVCARCNRIRPKSSHHIYPRQWFGRKDNTQTMGFCEECHRHLHQRLRKEECKKSPYKEPYPLSKQRYVEVMMEFIQEWRNDS